MAADAGPAGEEREGLFAAGDQVEHYRVARPLGKGGMGEVYLARDTRLGRRVALKVVRPERLGTGEAVERFLFEARTTARFNHPHIVTVYAVGEHEGLPYLALEYLEGQSLRDRMRADQPGIREALRLARAVADALAEAHAHGVLHRDLKPDNVLIPRDGRPRVVDFGLAKRVEAAVPRAPRVGDSIDSSAESMEAFETVERGRIRGTPAYMAPEQWTEEQIGPATDVWALGVMLYELLCDRRPFEAFETSHAELCMQVINPAPVPPLEGTREEIPEDVRDLVERCLAKAPERRPSAEEVRAELDHLLDAGRGRISAEEGPFRGLESFAERHAASFFGRDEEIASALERLREVPVLPVVGPSGAGKSSFVAAGLVPRLREQGPWTVVTLRPGGDPFHNLAARIAEGGRSSLVEDTLMLSGGPAPPPPAVSGVRTAEQDTAQWRSPAPDRRAASGDQTRSGEPLLRDVPGLADALRDHPRQLTLLLQHLAETRRSRVLLVVDQLEELYTLIDDEDVRRAFMRAVCTAADDPLEPVRVVLTLRDDFLGRLAETAEAREVLGRVMVLRSPGADALRETLTRPLEVLGYAFEDGDLADEMVAEVQGEAAGLPLLQFAARAMWERRDREAKRLTRRAHAGLGGVAGALAVHADGVLGAMTPEQVRTSRDILLRLVTPDGTRRTVSVERALEGLGDDGAEALRRLTDARLLTVHRAEDGEGDEARVELSHESLIERWTRLARWLEQGSEDLAFLHEVDRAAELWEGRGRRPEEVWTGEALSDALRSLQSCSAVVPRRVETFLGAGREREHLLQRRRRSRRVAGFAGLVVLVLISWVVAIAYIDKERQAVQGQDAAEQREAEALREAALAALLRGDPLEARAKLRSSLERRDALMSRALWWRLSRDPLEWQRTFSSDVYRVSFSPDGETVAVASMDRSVYLLDVRTAAIERVLRGHQDQVYAMDYCPDGTLISVDWDGELRRWDAAGETTLVRDTPGMFTVACSPDSRHALGGAGGGAVHEIDLESGETRQYCCHDRTVYRSEYSPDGTLVASASPDGTARIWDRASGAQRLRIDGHKGSVASVSFHPGEPLIATAGGDQTIRIWDRDSGAPRGVLRGHGGPVHALEFLAGGDRLASVSSDLSVRVWDWAQPERAPVVLRGHAGTIYGLDVHPDGQHVVSGALDRTVRLWSVPPGLETRREDEGHSDMVSSVAIDPAGTRIASSGSDGTVRLWDAVSGRQIHVLRGHTDELFDVAFGPDGSWLVTTSVDRTVRVWDAETGVCLRILSGHIGRGTGVAISPDGTRLASSAADRTVRLWDRETGDQVAIFGGPTATQDVAYGPHGRRVAGAFSSGLVVILDARDATERARFQASGDPIWGIAWSPDGERLAVADEGGAVRIWDVASRTAVRTLEYDARVYHLAWHPDGRRLGLPMSDHTARVVDLDSGEEQVLGPLAAEVGTVVFSADGAWTVTACDDGTVQVWDTDRGTPRWRAPLLDPDALALLTHEGWRALGSGPVPDELPGRAWARAVEQRAAGAHVAGDTLCLWTADGRVEGWSRGDDRRRFDRPVADVERVLAAGEGCVVLAGGAVERHTGADIVPWVREGARGLFAGDGELLVGLDGELARFAPDGAAGERVPLPPGVTAAQIVDGLLVLGFDNGNVETHGLAADAAQRGAFENTPAVPVTRLAAGPPGTVVAGFADGTVGLWLADGGAELDRVKLHGAVEHLLLHDGQLHAATRLGGYRSLDLGVFYEDRCALLEEVWAAVPVAWVDGAPVVEPPPAGHECR